MDKEQLLYWIGNGRFDNASKMCEECQWKEVNNNLLSIALEYKDISIFGFSKYMYDKTEDLKWLELAIEILIKALSHVDGAEQLASFYKRELLRSYN